MVKEDGDLACLQALFITDPFDDMEKIQTKRDKVLERTGSWVLSDQAFTKWLNDTSSSLLWLHGDPGKGKTMLAISLVRELSEKIRVEGSASSTAIAYFFCDNKDSRRMTGTSIFRGLIFQLLCQHPNLCFHLRDLYEKQKEHLFNGPNSIHSLWRVFQNIVRDRSLERIYIIVDALDECEPESAESFLSLLNPDLEFDFITQSQDLGTYQEFLGKIKWLLTSRNEVAIKQLLMGSLDISLETNANQVENAVRIFIKNKVKQLQRRKGYDKVLKDYVEADLCEKAEGTFLWVALACKELSKPTVLSMNTKNVLSKLPTGISPLYSRIMDQVISSEDLELVEYAKSILRCMVVALRPLTLTELAIAANLPEEYRSNLQVLSEYLNQCGSLVTIREWTAHFVHLSAKAFLLSTHTQTIISPDLRAEHQFIALNCFQHVCRRASFQNSRIEELSEPEEEDESDNSHEDVHDQDPEYPTLFWTAHTRLAPMEIADSFDFGDEFFQPRSAQRQLWFEKYWEKNHAKWETRPSDFTALHMAAYAGLPCLISKLLVTVHNPDDIIIVDSLGNTPLLWAAKHGYELVVRLLLKFGADTAAKNYEDMTALQWAAGNGHPVIVELLFKEGASLETADKNGWSPLHRAAYNGHSDVVRLLLDLGAEIEALDGGTWTVLHRAASGGHLEVIRLLMERGACLEALDREGMTPFLHAAWAGHDAVLTLQIDAGVDFHAADLEGWNALHNAAWNGYNSTAKLLLKHKINVHAKNGDGSTALHMACFKGFSAVVQILLEAGPDVNALDGEDESPLHQAAWRGHVSATQLLLATNVAVDLRDRIGQTALHLAASNGQEQIVRLLLEAGSDPTLEDKHGQSPRKVAEINDHFKTADVLREKEKEVQDFSEGISTPVDTPLVDTAVAEALSIDPTISTVQAHQAAGFFVPEKITTLKDGKPKYYYSKSGSNKEMFESIVQLFLIISVHR